ncbi:UNVERIFIED_CONTAM: hypothetical protein GTU68_009472, partial [Idotea baltica]|nr:hypothetical protein [Idotea baltica]
SYHENVLCFTNKHSGQRDGGTHLGWLRGALTRQGQFFTPPNGLPKKEKVTLTGDDARERAACVLRSRCRTQNSQSDKDKAGFIEVRPCRKRHW